MSPVDAESGFQGDWLLPQPVILVEGGRGQRSRVAGAGTALLMTSSYWAPGEHGASLGVQAAAPQRMPLAVASAVTCSVRWEGTWCSPWAGAQSLLLPEP